MCCSNHILNLQANWDQIHESILDNMWLENISLVDVEKSTYEPSTEYEPEITTEDRYYDRPIALPRDK